MPTNIERLRRTLNTLDPGHIEDIASIEPLLVQAWEELSLPNEGALTPDKLVGRMESLSWNPPVLSFEIERHGGTVMGSSRAEIQSWRIDLERCDASLDSHGYRQIHKYDTPLHVEPLADEIAMLIVEEQEDERIKWRSPDEVQINISKLIPDDGPKQTVQGRRKRFHNALSVKLRPKDWQRKSGTAAYQRQSFRGAGKREEA